MVAGWLAACGAAGGPGPVVEPEAGGPVTLTLPRLGGGSLSVDALRGRPVVLTLVATWDLRSQAEAPRMEVLHRELGPRGLEVVAVLLGPASRKELPMARTWAEVTGVTFPVLLAEADDLDLVVAVGPTPQVPRTLLLDRQGRVALEMMGRTDFSRLREAIDDLLGSAAR